MRFIDSMIDRYSRYEDRRRREGCRFLVFGALALIALGVVVVIIGAILAWVEEQDVISTYGEQIATLCDPVPLGTASIDNAPTGDSPFRLLMLTAGTGQRHAWFDEVQTAWRAEDEAAVDLVACVDETETILETCTYQRDASRGDGTFSIRLERVQHSTTTTLVNAETGQLIDQITVTGSEPETCPEDGPEITTSGTIEGSVPVVADIATWLEPFVLGTAVEQ